MGWKDWPYWIRGGIIGVLLGILVQFIASFGPSLLIGDVGFKEFYQFIFINITQILSFLLLGLVGGLIIEKLGIKYNLDKKVIIKRTILSLIIIIAMRIFAPFISLFSMAFTSPSPPGKIAYFVYGRIVTLASGFLEFLVGLFGWNNYARFSNYLGAHTKLYLIYISLNYFFDFIIIFFIITWIRNRKSKNKGEEIG